MRRMVSGLSGVLEQEAQLSHRGDAMLRVIEYFKVIQVIRNDILSMACVSFF